MGDLLAGVDLLLQLGVVLLIIAGLLGGFIVGVLPGVGGPTAAALVLPLTIGMPLHHGLILMVSIYAGSQFGAAVPAILVNIPGDAGSAATALDGHPMAMAGRAAEAIGIARMASVLGGVISCVAVILLLEPLSRVALLVGTREMFVVGLLSLLVIGTVVGDVPRKGILAALVGMLAATMAASPQTATPRFNLGYLELYEGIPIVPAMVGLFAFSQVFWLASHRRKALSDAADRTSDGPGGGRSRTSMILSELRSTFAKAFAGVAATLRLPRAVLQSTAIGLLIGAVPGAGSSVGSFMAYGAARRSSREPQNFGRGAPDGIVASEAADNAAAGGVLVPTLTLGVPGNATAALLLAAFYLHGIIPGPQVMQNYGAEAYSLLLGLLVASLLILPLGILVAAPLNYIVRFPLALLVPAIMLFAFIGVHSGRNLVFDIGLAVLLGVVGWIMRLHGYPVIPMVLGLILGPIVEVNFIRAVALSGGDHTYFFASPTVVILWILLAAVLVLAAVRSRRRQASPPMIMEQ